MKLIKETKDKNHYDKLEISMKTPIGKIYYPDLGKEEYDQIIDVINNLLSNINKHTK